MQNRKEKLLYSTINDLDIQADISLLLLVTATVTRYLVTVIYIVMYFVIFVCAKSGVCQNTKPH